MTQLDDYLYNHSARPYLLFHPHIPIEQNQTTRAPPVFVSTGDSVAFQVTNGLLRRKTSLHVSGADYRAEPFYDGIRQLTECGIGVGETRTRQVEFPSPGTFLYRSGAELQSAAGLAGMVSVADAGADSVVPLLIQSHFHEAEGLVWNFNYTADVCFLQALSQFSWRFPDGASAAQLAVGRFLKLFAALSCCSGRVFMYSSVRVRAFLVFMSVYCKSVMSHVFPSDFHR